MEDQKASENPSEVKAWTLEDDDEDEVTQEEPTGMDDTSPDIPDCNYWIFFKH